MEEAYSKRTQILLFKNVQNRRLPAVLGNQVRNVPILWFGTNFLECGWGVLEVG